MRMGLGGIEGLGGIPASIGGALVMNAGGAFGQIADVVRRVVGVARDGAPVALDRDQIDFGYRRSGLQGLILTACEIELRRGDAAALRDRLKEVMAYKKSTQPMSWRMLGCNELSTNPTVGVPTNSAAANTKSSEPSGARPSAVMEPLIAWTTSTKMLK